MQVYEDILFIGQKLGKKLRSSVLSRRGSKNKPGGDLKLSQTDGLSEEPRGGTTDSIYGSPLSWETKEDLLEERGSVLQSGGNMWKGKENLQERKDCRPDTFEDDLTKTKKLQFLDKSKAVYPDEMFTQKSAKNSMLLYNGDKPKEMQDCRPGTMVKTDSEKNWSLDTLGSSLNEEEGAAEYTPSWKLKHEAFCNDNLTSLDKGEQTKEMDSQSKKPIKMRVPRLPRKGSKSTLDEEFQQKGADLFKARDLKTSEFNMYKDYSELKKPPILRVPLQTYSDSKGLEDAGTPAKGAELFKAGNCDDTWTLTEEYTLAKDQYFPEDLDPTGATSSDYLSEAAKAEWRSSQMDVRRSRDPEDEQQLEAVEEEEEGDTDSLMEWWNTVELWDEVPSDEEISLKEDETKSFTEIAGKVHRGLRVFYKSFTEQAEVLYQHVLFLYAIADDLSSFHRRARIANITGGTTTAVGGVAAIAGLALAPVTFGASLIVSAVGLGVATAGGIAAASAAISDNVHDMSDRKKIELLVQDYETRLTDLQRCLHFVAEGIRRLCCHPLLRRNNYYTGDWEVRRALQTVSLVTEPVERAEEIVNSAIVALNNECKGMDKYFTKDSRELKKGCKKELTARVQMLAKQLHDGLVALNSIREQLLDATGNI
ncbi:uncharacterized protein LOC113585403 [Electrophorus electricus]|uniref:uncharacterized protein LOC113585403 n=1 Tax=Electrophorus electricus TaxID=8005 RepID=UPI0015D0AB03|nr:uncharacterized protein LOC113585403 [Electrophorus electricus]